MNLFLSWSWILLIALFIPIHLPAGAGSLNKSEIFSIRSNGSLFAGNSCFLRGNPSLGSPVLSKLKIGTPLRIIRLWKSPNGETWYHVQTSEIAMLRSANQLSRGWININV